MSVVELWCAWVAMGCVELGDSRSAGSAEERVSAFGVDGYWE
jgi:hypothetical protein